MSAREAEVMVRAMEKREHLTWRKLAFLGSWIMRSAGGKDSHKITPKKMVPGKDVWSNESATDLEFTTAKQAYLAKVTPSMPPKTDKVAVDNPGQVLAFFRDIAGDEFRGEVANSIMKQLGIAPTIISEDQELSAEAVLESVEFWEANPELEHVLDTYKEIQDTDQNGYTDEMRRILGI